MATLQGLMTAHIVDAYGIDATTTAFVEIDDTKTVAQLQTDVHDWAIATSGLSQGNLGGYGVDVFTAVAPGGPAVGDVEKGGLFNFDNATDPYAEGYWIPDIAPAILNANGLIDLTNVGVTDWITFMTTAHTVITVVTKGVRALTALRDALISFRKRRKPLSRKTKEV
jgi:hypothetical protein